MRALAILVLGLLVLASAKPSGQKRNRAELVELLRELVGKSPLTSSLSHQIRSGQITRGETDDDDDEESCAAELGITINCTDIDDNEDFFECAIGEAINVENQFADIFKAHTDNDEELFKEEEMDFIWEVRKSPLVAMQLKEYTEIILDELANFRFTDGVDFDALPQDVQDRLEALVCTYGTIRDECFHRAKSTEE